MKKVKFILGIHCHQPVGNFEHIIEDAYHKSYLPFILTLEKHPRIKFCVHYSGILYDWFMEKHPEYMDLLRRLVKRGQIEVMTGGYYEPILPMLPENDRVGQIEMSSHFIRQTFGEEPRGLWLTERIWEPSLPKDLNTAKVEYITVDDTHFISAGLPVDKLRGYYITEDQGHSLKIFPINKQLRYLVPFKLPEDTIQYLASIASETQPVAAILADDGEKFGVWPQTHKWVYEEHYLENLLNALEANASWIECVTFSEFMDAYPPLGRIYLPTASYAEMMEWSLLTEAGKKLEKLNQEMKNSGRSDDYSQFMKGGFFRNFFVKYPESNNLHKKMLHVSKKLETIKGGKLLVGEQEREKMLRQAEIDLYKGQCNCAYWHGVFGGLYLNYLRHALYAHLIKAEVELEKFTRGDKNYVELAVTDFDKDGNDEILLSNNFLNLYLAPSYGGAIFELDYKPKAFNLLNTLARREEVYHQKIQAAGEQPGGTPASIHDIVTCKEAGLEKSLFYDWYRRCSLLDHFLPADATLNSFSSAQYGELGDFTIEPYAFMPQRQSREVGVTLTRQGKVGAVPVKIEKNISLLAKQSLFEIEYTVTNLGETAADLWFGVEFNFAMLAGNAPDRYYQIGAGAAEKKVLESCLQESAVKLVKVVDDWSGFAVSLEPDKAAEMWCFPIATVSQSEAGFEKNYQSSVVFLHWKFNLGPQASWRGKITFRIEE